MPKPLFVICVIGAIVFYVFWPPKVPYWVWAIVLGAAIFVNILTEMARAGRFLSEEFFNQAKTIGFLLMAGLIVAYFAPKVGGGILFVLAVIGWIGIISKWIGR